MTGVRRNVWCEIDLAQFRRNLDALRPAGQASTLLVVKGNAYGHGLVRMAHEAVAWGVSMVGVGTVNEAATLVESGVGVPVLVISPLLDDEIEFCVASGVHFLAWRKDHFAAAVRAQERTGATANIHIELDFGMARSGVNEAQFVELLATLDDREISTVRAVCAHFAFAAVSPTYGPLGEKVEMLQRCVERLEARGVKVMRHVANSSATLRFPETHLDMVRMGVSAYGISSTKLYDVAAVVSPVLTWKAQITNVRELAAGEGVMYGWEYVADQPHRIATFGAGYADGFHRHPSAVNTVLVGGQEADVLGRVCMDQCVARVPEGSVVAVGDEVVLLGRQGEAEITAATLAQRWQTNGYDVVVGIRERVPRIYVNQ